MDPHFQSINDFRIQQHAGKDWHYLLDDAVLLFDEFIYRVQLVGATPQSVPLLCDSIRLSCGLCQAVLKFSSHGLKIGLTDLGSATGQLLIFPLYNKLQ